MLKMDDSGIADAFYTILSVSLVVIMGIAISGVILSAASRQSNESGVQLSEFASQGMKKGLYGYYYHVDTTGTDYLSADPNDILFKRMASERIDEIISFNVSNKPLNVPDNDGSVIWTGYLYVPKDGAYKFELESCDGSWLWIDGSMIADNHGVHGPVAIQSPDIQLSGGYHTIKVRYFYRDINNARCMLSWNLNGQMGPVYSLYR
ncbi:hypothetical protein CUJ83_07170 [Methanocella sp. CWC-04]|uniref:PA14 domain-containing protein n=1 Tax=Methanooceanicella nereidis TaxID=2052831 RepID=A0AAP2W5Y2_9EURY|nr:PA14 domain-containing protein [Methanocella sp. CWC-04]MCD1294778.1 hypothetical protein [Methanocella sp. CWC-04]